MSEFTDGTTKFVVTQSLGVLPGTVTAFSGTFNNGFPVDKNTGMVNKEWHLCDGTNDTPDLQNRFIYGGDGSNNGATGGETQHTLTVKEMPNDYYPDLATVAEDGGAPNASCNADAAYHGRVIVGKKETNARGGGQPHNNMPPYYALAYIMKL